MNTLERRVKQVAKSLHDHQIARLFRIPNDIRLASKDDGYQVIHGDQVPGDFIGYTVNGRALLVECKMTQADTLGTLKPHQRIALLEVQDAGGIGLLVWQVKDKIAVIDADQLRAYTVDRKTLPWRVIPPKYRKPEDVEDLELFWPWLSGAKLGPRSRIAAGPQSADR
jgi:hypothetical protein